MPAPISPSQSAHHAVTVRGLRLFPVVLLVASCLLPSPALAERLPGRSALLKEIVQTRKEIDRVSAGLFDNYGEPEAVQAIGCLWGLTQAWTAEYLNAHPQASAREILADLAPLAKAGDLSPSVVRLKGDAVVVSLDSSFQGTVFVVSRTPPQPFAVTWDIRTQPTIQWPDASMMPWVDTIPGVHGGPLGGRVLALPPTGSGRPRFLIEAIEHSGMGLEVPGQLSVWEWTGSEAVPEFVQGYLTTGGLSARLQGNRLRVRTKEELQRIYTCGSCDDPQGTWTLRITPDGVVDLGHVFDDPLLKFVDDLLDRVVRRQDASSLASRSARARLVKIADAERADERRYGFEWWDSPRFGMIDSWKVRVDSKRANRRVIDLQTDNVHLLFTLARRAGKPYVTAVQDLYAEE
jgi:hypothetical protein